MAIAFGALFGYIVMFLWNAILPEVVGAQPLSFWQAVGLLILSRILFGSFRYGPRGGYGGGPRRKYWKEKWMDMSEEERAEFKSKWKERCGWKREED
ncbi:MAG: hypothetical protein DHS20C18_22650 [Saprospiraceae bacterium]|nr:MAG: hypothetical protein DHS20C18_22650 [Saprospiraceae bacterium]